MTDLEQHDNANDPAPATPCGRPGGLDRRALLAGLGAAAAGLVGVGLFRAASRTTAPVFLARDQRYDGPLVRTIRDGLAAVGFDAGSVRGRRVLLKPNLIEPIHTCPHMTTHPAVVLAAAEVFRSFGAEVAVGEGPGHIRDTELALVESGLEAALRSEKLAFADLNYSQVVRVPNAARVSSLQQFLFPREVAEADLIVSLPKLKTHHWVGITAAMKNLYGTLPGVVYGWPKNALHYAGIPQSVVDINASLGPTIAVVDGILCMEGDGPVMGTPKPMGILGVGLNLPALDATLARIIGLDPYKVPYLALADGRLGPIAQADALQRGERWQELHDPFQIVDVPHLQAMRA